MDTLLSMDRAALLWLNGCNSPWTDTLMSTVSEKWVWLPFYVLLAVLLIRAKGWRAGILFMVGAGIVVLACDQVTSGVLKPLVARPRPCHDPELAGLLHLVDQKCGGPFGFASSHAANFAGLATYVGQSLWNRWKWPMWVLGTVCLLVGISRVYLGVHYPSDVLVGWVLGILLGLAGYLVSTRVQNRIGGDGRIAT